MRLPPRASLSAKVRKHLPGTSGSPAFTLDVALEAEPGVTVLFGPSGSGKTLTLDCIAGLATPDEGRVLLDEQLYFDAQAGVNVPAERRRCGYVFQEDVLFPHMTLRQNLRFAGSVARGPVQRGLHMRRRINDLLESFELLDLADRKPGQLSGGQQQRATLARILVGEPKVLLLDEPSKGLDAQLRSGFHNVLRAARARLDVPVLFVTHDVEECFALADQVYIMQGGRCLQSGPAAQVLNRPATLEVVRLLGVHAVMPAEILALDPGRNTSRLHVLATEIKGPYLPGHLIGDRGYLCVRASELQVRTKDQPANGNEVSLRKESATASPQGVQLMLEGGVPVTMRASDYDQLGTTERISFQIPDHAISFLAG